MALNYESLRAEPGILIEVFLPKRNRFQGILYETLEDGFNHEKEDEINNYLKWLQEKDIKPINDDIKVYFETVLRGYSIYEVDGVFFGDSNGSCHGCAGSDLRKVQFGEKDGECEERTQVIKIIFMPDYEEITSRLQKEVETFEKQK